MYLKRSSLSNYRWYNTTRMSYTPKPLILLILDGWGYRQETRYNAIAAARKPVWDALWKRYPMP